MIDTSYRTLYQQLCVDPLLKMKWVQKIHPHLFTMAACLLGSSILVFLFLQWHWIAFFALVLSGFLDTFDGSLARYLNKSSMLGAALDITADRFVEFSIILGLYFVEPSKRALLCLVMLGSILLCITTFLVVGIFTQNSSEKSFFYSPGIIERTEAFFFFGSMILFPPLFLPLSLSFTILVSLTATIRLWQFSRRNLNSEIPS
jgi:phosphatidylglycerophosphate synthase